MKTVIVGAGAIGTLLAAYMVKGGRISPWWIFLMLPIGSTGRK